MTSNHRIILEKILEQNRTEIAPSLEADRYFDIFTSEQILKDYDLSYNEILSGIVDGGGDGGIDSFYVFVNGELLQEDNNFSSLRKNIKIDIFLIQSKLSPKFKETALDKFITATEELFDLSKKMDELKCVYNEPLLDAVDRFRVTFQDLASKFPELRLSYYYASTGDEIHPNVKRKVARIESAAKQHFSEAIFSFDFLGAKDLLTLARKSPTTTYELRLSEIPISSTGDIAFVCLVSLSDFYDFITDQNGKLIRPIFEANVRDYQGKTEVNEQIQQSLQHQETEDFWWLNNGVTILCTRATQGGKTITIENPEIVNGLQTSTEIYTYFSNCNTKEEERNMLVRVIVPRAQESRDRVIRATNSQTTIPRASLRATDRIHRDIEEYLKAFGFYYDRRKNYYKNEGKPIDRIVSIPQMAQAVMAIVLKKPDMARARPSSLIKRDDDYKKIFNTKYPIEVYRSCVEILKRAVTFLNSHDEAPSSSDRNNLKFYVAMAATQIALSNSEPTPDQIASLAGKGIDEEVMIEAYWLVDRAYTYFGRSDQVAKGTDLVANINNRLSDEYPKQKTRRRRTRPMIRTR